MKTYTIKDKKTNKIYTVKEKVKDAVSLKPGDAFVKGENTDIVYRVLKIDNKEKHSNSLSVVLEKYYYNMFSRKIEKSSGAFNQSINPSDIQTVFPSMDEAIKYLKVKQRRTESILSKAKDSIHDEASLSTTINALINDEKAAIDAYNVAIKNLEGQIEDAARQVLINIRNDERRHIENLYSILNKNITEKNLEDSKIKDAAPGVDKEKFNRLVEYFNVHGKPNRADLQKVIDSYRLNSATAYQLLLYWGYKNEFEKLHFYDSAKNRY